MKWQTHDFKGQQQVRKNDGGIYAQDFRSGDGDFGGERGFLAELKQRVVLANCAVLGHVASGLPHKPYWGAVDRLRFTSAYKIGVSCRHKPLNLASLAGMCCDLRPGGFVRGWKNRG